MKYKLIKPVNENYTAQEQVLVNRGINYKDIPHYLHTTDNDINDFKLLGEDKLKNAATALITAINQGLRTSVIVDSDDDGFTSAAILINYLYDFYPSWVENNLIWFIHEGKQHGLNDCIDWAIENKSKLVICPDSGSNDLNECKKLQEYNIPVIILDHHELEIKESDSPAIVINSQLEPYPNKELSGAGVVYQFCRYLDTLLNSNNADKYIDLVALGLTGDMQSLRSIETKHLINKGFEPDNIHNPFIYSIWQKNQFKLGQHITSWGAAFYIVPFVNALVRSGTQEEKELIFESMLAFKAFEEIPSNKRGHKAGETERKVDQAMRTCTNVKNRQTNAQDVGMELLENMIEEQNLLENKVLLFLLEPGQIDRSIAGLVANKFMSKYQRPCCILTKVENKETEEISYQGSARGCDKVGVTEFKDICAATGSTMYTIGHQGAFGLGIREKDIPAFIASTNEQLKDMSDEAIYYVDYIYEGTHVNAKNILDIADMGNFWGKDIDESLIAIKDLKVTKDMITLMSPDKNPTLKIMLPNKISIIKFGSNQEEYENLLSEGFVKIDIIGKCNCNEWLGNITPQIMIEAYEITERVKYFF